MPALLHPTYFPNIAHCSTVLLNTDIFWELHDNYQKQTLRNRTLIYSANGSLSLSIPVVYSQNNRQLYKDIKIANTENWQSHHWKSIVSAYNTSPFFEFYKDDLKPLFTKKSTFLLEHNLACFKIICECLQLNLNIKTTSEFIKNPEATSDYRYLVNVRKLKLQPFSKYTQVFTNKHGFLDNLSILDLLFNEGPNAVNYLQKQKVAYLED